MAVLTTALVWGYSPVTANGKVHKKILSFITCRVLGSPIPIVGLSAGKTPSSPLSHGLNHHLVNRKRHVIGRAESLTFFTRYRPRRFLAVVEVRSRVVAF